MKFDQNMDVGDLKVEVIGQRSRSPGQKNMIWLFSRQYAHGYGSHGQSQRSLGSKVRGRMSQGQSNACDIGRWAPINVKLLDLHL